MSTTSTATLTPATHQVTWSSANIRERLTPCHSGVSRATQEPTSPRLVTGKNAPEKRNSGNTPSRNRTAKASSELLRAENP